MVYPAADLRVGADNRGYGMTLDSGCRLRDSGRSVTSSQGHQVLRIAQRHVAARHRAEQ